MSQNLYFLRIQYCHVSSYILTSCFFKNLIERRGTYSARDVQPALGPAAERDNIRKEQLRYLNVASRLAHMAGSAVERDAGEL